MKNMIFTFLLGILGFTTYAIQTHAFYIGNSNEGACHQIFIVQTEDDGTYIASGIASIGDCSGMAHPSLTNPKVGYKDDPNDTPTISFVDYLQSHPMDEAELSRYLEENYPEYFPDSHKSGRAFPDAKEAVQPKLFISPNPSNGIFEVLMLGYSQEKEISVVVFDVSGKMVYEGNLKLQDGYGLKKIDFTKMKDGAYILHIKGSSTNETRTIKKL